MKNQQSVFLFEDVPLPEVLERAEVDELVAFFKYNEEHPNTNVPYIKFPEMFIYEKKHWRIRKQGTTTLGRVYSIHPSKGETFYLRMLLSDTTHNHSAGKKSYEDLKTVNGIIHESYKDTCRALGLLEDDELWTLVMEDAKYQKLPKQMRDLFLILLSEADLSNPRELFEKYNASMSEDYAHQLLPPDDTNAELLRWMLLIEIESIMCRRGAGGVPKIP